LFYEIIYRIFGVTKTNQMKLQLTKNEIEILTSVANSQIEDGFSEYTSVDSSSEKGTLGSLVKKKN
jgi:hypothetical protein